ncbi:hypothetical protein DRV85_14265 [Rhodosalinus halophilus]|uniref:Lipoprotein n=1 Tax=Rhodosalinus halophilus TaxID=2259333 RepID=A0A365U5W5_9RHOB|nr:hypothetical protein [Rhodosalinus halophilus]RBI83814.1 hypothetical protein DRV85_14265 [Rhodosalinus halophilus]
MKNIAKTMVGIGLLAGLSACMETTGSPTASQMPAAPGGPPFIEGSFSASQAAVDSCRNLLASQTTGGVRVVGSESSEANHAVYMRVGENGAPWRCLVGGDGRNPSVMFLGSEGFA